jgi:pyruvate, orthophosphate dikinase
LDYVSCSPFRVPIARLAAGQAAAKRQAKGTAASKQERVLSKAPMSK